MAGDISARELTERVWNEVAEERVLRPPPPAGLPHDYHRLAADGERHYVNSRYVLNRSPHEVEEPGLIGRAKARVRVRAARFVMHTLAGYLDDEQEFLAHLVRLQNAITVNVDRLSAEVRQLEGLLQAESDHLRAADAVLHARLEDRIKALEDELADLRRQDGGSAP